MLDDGSKGRVLKGPEVSRELYGGVLDFDTAGHYPGLELLNFVYCGGVDDILPRGNAVNIVRRSHDFGRRLVWDESFINDPRRHTVLLDDEAAEGTLRELLRCLQLDIPSGSKDPKWSRAHFFPYTPSLIHWDARERNKTIRLERLYLRGGGALAFKILRTDENYERNQRMKEGFQKLYSATAESPLEILAGFINEQSKQDVRPSEDEIEKLTRSNLDRFEDIYRDGVLNILEQREATSVAKVRAIMGWTGLWLVLMQNRRSRSRLGLGDTPLICDCGANSPQLRRASQRCLQEVLDNIVQSVGDVESKLPNARRNNIRSFFWATAAANGFLNAWRGRKHFTLSVDALEMIVLATIPSGKELPYERFVTEVLFERLGIAIGRGAAEAAGLVSSIDASIFEENEAQLADQMIAAGLVTQYSDATRMVSPRNDV
ncbi:hypothetical protein [Marinobacter sp. 1_MG-2023]|uniref:hypothetical protein n=1 Tax=Marinobacter sp. 1_MG-2023 TaxID=3062627 RepID=UPI0026E23043|nr:hypothetical protein [Marinobacter sp. 1_MG-2023]MDO6825000.1 hypothetical protein [Marinobacter sp. 1_MG-2023]